MPVDRAENNIYVVISVYIIMFANALHACNQFASNEPVAF